MDRDREQVRVCANMPVFIAIEMHISRDRLRVRWRRIKRVGQRAARPVERKSVAVILHRELNGHRSGSRCILACNELDRCVLRPRVQGAQDLLSRLGRVQFRRDSAD